MTTTIPSRGTGTPYGADVDIGLLYRRHRGMVEGYLRGQGARDPEDLAADVFVGVLRNLHRFEGDDAAFRSWLLVIAHRRLVDQRRARARRPVETRAPLQMTQLVDRMTAGTGDAETEALSRLEADRLLDALGALTDDQRTVVLLHAVGDLSLPQIAGILGKRLGAVKSLHHRGLAAAARALGDPVRPARPRTG